MSTTRVVLGIAALVVVYFLATAAFNFVHAQQLHRQENELQAEIKTLQERQQRLQALKQYLDSDEYIEAVAREQLGLVKKGEKAFIAISTSATPTPNPEQSRQELWWESLSR